MTIIKQNATFTAASDSAIISPCAKGPIMAIRTPASFGSATLALLYSDTVDGTFVPVKNEKGEAIAISGIDTTNGAMYDLSNICALGVGGMVGREGGYFKLRAAGAITATVVVYVLESV